MGMNVDVSRYVEDAKGMGEVAADRYYRRRALEWIGSNPWEAVELYSRKVLNYFNYRNRLHVESEASAFKNLIMLFTYYPLLALGIGRLIMTRIKPLCTNEIGMYVIYFGNAFASAVFLTGSGSECPTI